MACKEVAAGGVTKMAALGFVWKRKREKRKLFVRRILVPCSFGGDHISAGDRIG